MPFTLSRGLAYEMSCSLSPPSDWHRSMGGLIPSTATDESAQIQRTRVDFTARQQTTYGGLRATACLANVTFAGRTVRAGRAAGITRAAHAENIHRASVGTEVRCLARSPGREPSRGVLVASQASSHAHGAVSRHASPSRPNATHVPLMHLPPASRHVSPHASPIVSAVPHPPLTHGA